MKIRSTPACQLANLKNVCITLELLPCRDNFSSAFDYSLTTSLLPLMLHGNVKCLHNMETI